MASRQDPQVNIRMKPELLERLRAYSEDAGVNLTEAMHLILDASVPALPKSVTQMKVRLSGDLHQRIQASAKRNKCSANAEINRRLESTFL